MGNLITVKSWISLPLFGIAIVNLLMILEASGRKERRFDPLILRKIHRGLGWYGVVSIFVLSFLCMGFLQRAGGEMSARGAVHALTGAILLSVIIVKVLIVRFYRKYFSYVPALGIIVFVFLMTTLILSSGSYLFAQQYTSAESDLNGQALFKANCSACHYDDRTDRKIGPGLKGLSSREKLPVSGRPVNRENLILQLQTPYGTMPSFKHLSKAEISAIVNYLLTL